MLIFGRSWLVGLSGPLINQPKRHIHIVHWVNAVSVCVWDTQLWPLGLLWIWSPHKMLMTTGEHVGQTLGISCLFVMWPERATGAEEEAVRKTAGRSSESKGMILLFVGFLHSSDRPNCASSCYSSHSICEKDHVYRMTSRQPELWVLERNQDGLETWRPVETFLGNLQLSQDPTWLSGGHLLAGCKWRGNMTSILYINCGTSPSTLHLVMPSLITLVWLRYILHLAG